jgi:hypothetical protein
MGKPSCAVIALIALSYGLLTAGSLPAQQSQGCFDALVAAGEYGPAIEMAQLSSEPAERDRRFAQIVDSQASFGARTAALRTASEIYDDRARARALNSLAERPLGAPGGAEADFEAIIELIQSTIAPNTWDDVGGPGAIQEFAGGVYVDSVGVLKPLVRETKRSGLGLLHTRSALSAEPGDVRRKSSLRKISLNRLEKQVQLRLAADERPTEAMEVLAGLQRIKYVLVYPESGDIVLAGPAGDWRTDGQQRSVSAETGAPVVRLDDLVVVFQHILGRADARFGCSITPTEAGLGRTKSFLQESSKRSLRVGEREKWLEQVRAALGTQDIEVRGLDPQTRAARVMVEADYHMKLVGIGLAEGVLGVKSYLDSVEVPPGQAPPPMDVLRWWFTLNYKAVLATEDRQAFEIRGPGVQVLSENELLTLQGKRVHTGKSDALNQQFAGSFTEHYDALCAKYPIYVELRNVFDLALVAALLRSEDIPSKAGWGLTCFNDPAYPIERGAAPKQVDTVINHRVINRVHILAGVSGGVSAYPAPLVRHDKIAVDKYGRLSAEHAGGLPRELDRDAWWWD